MDRRRRHPVRLLPDWPDHGGRGSAQPQSASKRRRHRQDFQSLPLRIVSAHSQGDQARGGCVTRGKEVKRRQFLTITATASGALLISFARAQESLPYLGAREEPSSVGPFIRIEKNGAVIIGTRSIEAGQGVKTSLAMLI